MQADIDALMDGDLGQWLTDQQAMRAAAKAKAHKRWLIGAIALVPLLAILWLGVGWSQDLRFMISAIAAGGVFAWGQAPIQAAKKAMKIGINSAIAASLGLAYEHDVERGPAFDLARSYALLPSYDRRNLEDRWYGTLDGHGFDLFEAHLEEERGSGKNRRHVTVFRGAVIALGFGRPFHSTTLLQRAGKHRKWFGLGGRADHVNFDGHRLDYVDQVHPVFEDVFELWSDDQVEARVLVHPSYVEHLLEVENAFDGDAVRALFIRGEVLIAVESGNMFESGSMKASEDRARVEQAARQFGAIAGLARAINQNERGRVVGPISS
ncbi:DUF3137 domain-containing protein [Erythrobacter sp.]|uniref:DUF3137 domain-containing protein n=1 Tax=Erythrobacter sp. TaxID=1042 RepID=UPI003C76809C